MLSDLGLVGVCASSQSRPVTGPESQGHFARSFNFGCPSRCPFSRFVSVSHCLFTCLCFDVWCGLLRLIRFSLRSWPRKHTHTETHTEKHTHTETHTVGLRRPRSASESRWDFFDFTLARESERRRKTVQHLLCNELCHFI